MELLWLLIHQLFMKFRTYLSWFWFLQYFALYL